MFASAFRTVISVLTIALVVSAAPGPAGAAVTCGDTGQGANFAGGNGTDADPYLIATEAHLTYLRNASSIWSCAFRQVAPLDFSTEGVWVTGIGQGNAFTGSYDGGGFEIRAFHIDNANLSEIGLFSRLSGATVTSVVLTDLMVRGVGSVGGLAGRAVSNTVISDVVVSGQVDGKEYVGGLAGYADSTQVARTQANVLVQSDGQATSNGSFGGLIGFMFNSSIAVSESSGSILAVGTNAKYVGGLAGYVGGTSGSTLVDSLSRVEVSGRGEVGGVIGFMGASTLERSYGIGETGGSAATGGLIGSAVSSSVVDSFWDEQTTTQPSSAGGGTGLTTAQMQSFSTFADAGWSIAEGFSSSATWGICPAVNGGYPFLSWQHSSSPCGSSASSAAMAEFTFRLPDGRECSAISPVRVPVGSMFELPGEDALCRSMPGATVAGWVIPGAVGSTGFGSSANPFPPGLRVRVVDSQQFTVVPLEPVLSVTLDANVASDDACLATQGRAYDGVRVDGRASTVWIPRDLVSMARFPDIAVCTPQGHQLVGWTDGEARFGLGDPVPSQWAESSHNARHLMAIWAPE